MIDFFTKWSWLLPVLLFVGFVSHATTSERTLRCQGRLVSIGDTPSVVRQKCGEPDRTTSWEEGHNTAVARIFDYETERYQAPVKVQTPVQMQRWLYDFGPTRFVRHLVFENGKLIRIETGEKGSGGADGSASGQ